MARTVEVIFNSIVAEKQTLAELAPLLPSYNLPADNAWLDFVASVDSSSVTATWRLWCYIAALAAHEQEVLWDAFNAEVDAKIASHKPGTKLWYRQMALDFQDGYALYWIDDRYQYTSTDATAKIVKQCSVTEANGEVRIKVASVDGSGNLIPLTTQQLSRLRAYFERIKYAGTTVVVVSYAADTINSLFTFTYDALYDISLLKLAAKAAVKTYLSSLSFNGAVVLNGIIDALQAVPGVVDAVPVAFEGKYGALPYTSFLALGEYATNAGYAVLDETIFDTATWNAE